MKTIQRSLWTLLSGCWLAGCSLTPEYKAPDLVMPESWRDELAIAEAEPIPGDWWTLFGSDELYGLVEQARRENSDIRIGLHRIAQARAQAKIAGAALHPAVGAAGSLSRDWDEPFSNNGSGISGYGGQLDVSYEVDLWGRNSASAESARLRVEATAFDQAALELIVASDVVTLYGDALALNERLRLTTERLRNVREILAIVEARFREGAVSGLEVAQQRTELANLEASAASLEQQRLVTTSQIAVLTGQPPQTFELPQVELESLVLPDVALSPPATLLARRPDLRRAETDLLAAHADIGAARAAFFPALDLGAGLSAAASPIGSAVSSGAGLAASLTAPIFQGGRLQGGLEYSKAVRDELLERYRLTVLQSFQEAEDALAGLRSANKRLFAYSEAVRQAERAYDISRERFEVGSVDFLTLLDAQRSLLQAQENLVLARFDRLAATVLLIKAMGGGWQG